MMYYKIMIKKSKLILTNKSINYHTRKTRQNDQYMLDKNGKM